MKRSIMPVNYQHKLIETKVQKFWELNNTFSVIIDLNKPKFYCLTMLPYPSGKLHMGHVRNYTAGDIIARFNRQKGKNVLHPIGWDSFGLPAELAAINNNISPRKWTLQNIKLMKQQLKNLGLSYDWKREISTCNEDYYKWEQWFFIQLYKKGIIYRHESYVNWCQHDNTVLANEQVIDDRCWRCNKQIKIKKLPQWFLKITAYAEELLKDIDLLTEWPKKVKDMQRNWIGKRDGYEVHFSFLETKSILSILGEQSNTIHNFLTIFTPYISLIMGVTYITISLDHPLTNKLSKINTDINNFINQCLTDNNIYKRYKNNKETHIDIKGINTYLFLIHPITKKLLPLWIINTLALYDPYNQSINWGIPAHYKESFYFATRYGIKIYPFIKDVNNIKVELIHTHESDIFNNHNYLLYDYKENIYVPFLESENNIFKKLSVLGVCNKSTKYKIRDWLISRQRSWGVPIPILFNNKNKDIFKPEKEINLPINFYKNDKTEDHVDITNRLKESWYPEKDTLDTFFQSSWYYARYTCPKYKKGMLDIKQTNYWLPIDQYIGGIEHAILHLMYFRLFHKLMKEMNLVNCVEPAIRLLCQGMVLADTYCYIDNNNNHHWISPETISKMNNKLSNNIVDAKGRILTYMGLSKMSKSKNNGIDPNLMIELYGADAVRLFVMFAAPIKMDLIWEESGVKGMYRFLNRVWKLIYLHIKKGEEYSVTSKKYTNNNILYYNKNQKNIFNLLVATVDKVFEDIDKRQSFNTAIAVIMNLSNQLNKFIYKSETDWYIMQKILKIFMLILYPFAPHISFNLWEQLTGKNNIDKILWPNIEYIKDQEESSNIEILVQINNKFKKKIKVPLGDMERKEYIQKYILEQINLKKYLVGNKLIKEIIWIKNKIINIIIN